MVIFLCAGVNLGIILGAGLWIHGLLVVDVYGVEALGATWSGGGGVGVGVGGDGGGFAGEAENGTPSDAEKSPSRCAGGCTF